MSSKRATEHLSEKTVRQRLRRFEKTFRPYRAKLTARYGEAFSDKVMADTRAEYGTLLPETPVFPGPVNIFNTVIGINTQVVSLHRAMRANGRTVRETGEILFEVAQEEHDAIPRPLRWIARKAIFSRLFLMLTRASARRVHDHPQGWKIDYRKGDGAAADWYFECRECGVIKYFERCGVQELGPYCNYVDYIQSNALGLGMQNPQNIGQGAPICVERFKQGRETVLPDNLRAIASGRHPGRPRADLRRGNRNTATAEKR